MSQRWKPDPISIDQPKDPRTEPMCRALARHRNFDPDTLHEYDYRRWMDVHNPPDAARRGVEQPIWMLLIREVEEFLLLHDVLVKDCYPKD